MSDIDSEHQDAGLSVLPIRNGLKAGVDNIVDVLLCIRAPETIPDGTGDAVFPDWNEANEIGETFEQHLERMATLAFCDVKLWVRVLKGVTVELPGDLEELHGAWRLPDMPWGSELLLPVRLVVPAALLPPAGDTLRVARPKLQANNVREHSMSVLVSALDMPVMTEHEYEQLPEDEWVRDRIYSLAED